MDIKPYKGAIYDIDLNQDWYCPYCLTKLMLSHTKDSLGCTTHYEVCDYSHQNEEARIRRGIELLEGYKFPITKARVDDIKVKELAAARNRLLNQLNLIDDELKSYVTKKSENYER
ncbi:hypothetical protein LZS85_15625 [Aliivibrio fischeri]|uniref:hypothetical protein n=1 Tax=Aliivibrio fischeri TaxID=668 RepID=UPI001F484424|nr:hypothetical protein [Aliivibrio fischeri]MCE7567553.1 hypothetical protein [Aliivibrio fischeri]